MNVFYSVHKEITKNTVKVIEECHRFSEKRTCMNVKLQHVFRMCFELERWKFKSQMSN